MGDYIYRADNIGDAFDQAGIATRKNVIPAWRDEWRMMPEYSPSERTRARKILVSFETENDVDDFFDRIRMGHTKSTRFIWYPESEDQDQAKYIYRDNCSVMPRYPVYIISKGRWETRHTVLSLDRIKVPYLIVVEPSEYDRYANVIDKDKILRAPENFSERGCGSVPVRNFVWQHAVESGAEKHWLLDDNINGFIRIRNHQRLRVYASSIFRMCEDFTDRYENIAFSGFNARWYARPAPTLPAFYLNSRVYSCTLINNCLSYRWRGRYNEDTDIILRALKDGWCTITINAIAINKAASMTISGGNTDSIYNTGDKRFEFAKSLERQHPDVVRAVWREDLGRWHHKVDYSPFAVNKLVRISDDVIPPSIYNYGMDLAEEKS